jgi:hypothetical protein
MAFVLATVGTGLTLWQFASPWPQLSRAAASNCVDRQDLVTLIAMTVNAAIWSAYAVILADEGLFFQNGLCLLLGIYFNCFYYQHSREKHVVTATWAAAFALLTAGLAYCLFVVDWQELLHHVGLLCAVTNVLMQCSPFGKVRRAAAVGDFSEVPLGVCFAGLAASVTWAFYGLLIANPYVTWTSAICAMAALIQIALYVAFNKALPSAVPSAV